MYSNRQHSSQNQYQHRGALTKLKSSSTAGAATNGATKSRAGLAVGVGGAAASSSAATKAFGAGRLGVGRNVPKLVNTSSLRKENGGQDITAVLVNRHGGECVHCVMCAIGANNVND